MWTYRQFDGTISRDNFIGYGYAGNGVGKNNPAMEDVPFVGPLPCGIYIIEPPIKTEKHGPYVLWLIPDPSNEMFGRSDFGIHGDNIELPGTASEGCIVLPRIVRKQIWESGDHLLEVVSGL